MWRVECGQEVTPTPGAPGLVEIKYGVWRIVECTESSGSFCADTRERCELWVNEQIAFVRQRYEERCRLEEKRHAEIMADLAGDSRRESDALALALKEGRR